MSYTLRDFKPSDADAVNQLALLAFEQFRGEYSDWQAFSRNIGSMSSLSDAGELIVVTDQEIIVGAVVYVGPHKPKREFFLAEWPILRMLVVNPAHRGHGIGRLLTDECISRAKRDGSKVVALHTSRIMEVALSMYLRMGFEFKQEAPAIFGVPYGIYVKALHAQPTVPSDANASRHLRG
jgi:ribosomal protein S18 acetylase RimI-like enzyme